MPTAKNGDNVKIHYTGTLGDGSVFDSSAGREPLACKLGSGQLIPGFEEAVLGMNIGDSKKVTIPMDKAYGSRNDDLVITVPRNQVPPEIEPEIGLKLQMGGPNGEIILVEVVDLGDETITLDANPPLAGQDLTFEIELVAIG
jgi:peptidylprolyl isomerase